MKLLSLALAGTALLVASTFANAADLAAGKATWEKINCASCHGADAKSPILPEYPVLAGQHADYLAHALKAYQRGAHEAPSTANGRKNAVMGAFAVQLSSQDISNVTAWLASLPGPLSVHK
jgi:cytochrome c553